MDNYKPLETVPFFSGEVPRGYLRGTQPLEEYRSVSRNRVVQGIKRNGFNYLLNNPIEVLAVPDETKTLINFFIRNGHHRVRHSEQFETVPSNVYLLGDLAKELGVNPIALTQSILQSANYTEQTFYESYLAKGKSFVQKNSLSLPYEQFIYDPSIINKIDNTFLVRSVRSNV